MVEALTYSAAELARLAGVSKSLIYSLARQNRLPGMVKIGRRTKIGKAAADKWLRGEEATQSENHSEQKPSGVTIEMTSKATNELDHRRGGNNG